MTSLLLVQTSPRAEHFVSRTMAASFVEHWRSAHPAGEVIVRDLARDAPAFITDAWLAAYFTPPEDASAQTVERLRFSDQLVDELLAADHLVISTPVYNFPASLKAWVDSIVRKGRTLGFDGKGLVTGKRATVLIASGGVYTEGSPIRDRDFAPRYLQLILGVIGFQDVRIVAGGGAKAVDLGEQTMPGFLETLQPQIRRAAEAGASPSADGG